MMHAVRQISALVKLSLLDLYRRKDMAVVVIFLGIVIVPLLFVSPFGVKGASRYINELTLLLIWVFTAIIGVARAAQIFPLEIESRTIFPMMAKPIHRGQIVVGRYLGVWLALASALIVFYGAYGILVGVRSGTWFVPVFWQALVLHLGFLAIVSALALLGSLFMTASANVTCCGMVCVGMLVYGSRLEQFAEQQGPFGKAVLCILNWVAPHVEFFDMRHRLVHDWPSVSWGVCALALGYAVAYTTLCLMAAAVLFKNKRI